MKFRTLFVLSKTLNIKLLFYLTSAFILSLILLDLNISGKYRMIFLFATLPIFLLLSLTVYLKSNRVELMFSSLILIISFYNMSSFPFTANISEIIYPLLFILYVFIIFNWIVLPSNDSLVPILSGNFDKILMYLFFVLFFISALFYNVSDLTDTVGFFKYGVVFMSLIVNPLIIGNLLLKNEDYLTLFLKSLVYIGLVGAIFGLMTYAVPSLNQFNFYGAAISFFRHPNATSSLYNFTIPITLYFILFKKNSSNSIERLIFSISFFLSTVALFLTFSRFGIVSVLISCIFLMFFYSRKLFIAMLIFLPIAFVYTLTDFFVAKGVGTIVGRVGLVMTTIDMLSGSMQKLFFGYGIISAENIFEETKLSLGVMDQNNVPHNIIIYYILMFGLSASFFISVYVFKSFFKVIVFLLKGKLIDNILLLCISIILGIFLKNMAEDLLVFPEFFMWHLFLIFWGILFVILNISSKKFKKPLS